MLGYACVQFGIECVSLQKCFKFEEVDEVSFYAVAGVLAVECAGVQTVHEQGGISKSDDAMHER